MMTRLSLFAVATVLVAINGCDDLATPTGPSKGGIPIESSTADRLVVQGDVKEMFGKAVTNWVVLDPETKVLKEFKWTLPVTAVENVPDNVQTDVRNWPKLPKEFAEQTVFYGMSYDYLPHGHAPASVYDVKHWEFHFITFSQEESVAIDCQDPTFPPTNLLPTNPPGWATIPPPDNCVPGMGIHAASFLLPEFQRERFKSGGLVTYYHGKFASLEYQATVEVLKQRQSFPVLTPKAPMAKAGLYPGKLYVNYDRDTDTYIFELTDFVQAEVVTAQ